VPSLQRTRFEHRGVAAMYPTKITTGDLRANTTEKHTELYPSSGHRCGVIPYSFFSDLHCKMNTVQWLEQVLRGSRSRVSSDGARSNLVEPFLCCILVPSSSALVLFPHWQEGLPHGPTRWYICTVPSWMDIVHS
jgi:hypothetical protein